MACKLCRCGQSVSSLEVYRLILICLVGGKGGGALAEFGHIL